MRQEKFKVSPRTPWVLDSTPALLCSTPAMITPQNTPLKPTTISPLPQHLRHPETIPCSSSTRNNARPPQSPHSAATSPAGSNPTSGVYKAPSSSSTPYSPSLSSTCRTLNQHLSPHHHRLTQTYALYGCIVSNPNTTSPLYSGPPHGGLKNTAVTPTPRSRVFRSSKKSPTMNSIFSATPYSAALCFAHAMAAGSVSMA